VPAAAVIPAPIAYIKVAAVKKLVVGFRNKYSRGWVSLVVHLAYVTSEASKACGRGRNQTKE